MIFGALVIAAFIMVVPGAVADGIAAVRAAWTNDQKYLREDQARRRARTQRIADAWSHRRATRSLDAGGDGTYRPGIVAYGKDLYHGFFEGQLEKSQQRRTGRDRLDAMAHKSFEERVAEVIEAQVASHRLNRNGEEFSAAPAAVKAQPVVSPSAPAPATPFRPRVVRDSDDLAVRRPLAPAVDEPAVKTPEAAIAAEASETAPPPLRGPHTAAEWAVIDRRIEQERGMAQIQKEIEQERADRGAEPEGESTVTSEVMTNDDVRNNAAEIAAAAAEMQEGLAIYEAARARARAAQAASADGMSAANFDSGAVAATADIGDNLDVAAMSHLAEIADNVHASARAAHAHLDKYRDAEDLVAQTGISTETLAPTSS